MLSGYSLTLHCLNTLLVKMRNDEQEAHTEHVCFTTKVNLLKLCHYYAYMNRFLLEPCDQTLIFTLYGSKFQQRFFRIIIIIIFFFISKRYSRGQLRC